MLKVAIADDSALLRARLAALISDLEGIELVAQAGNAQEVLEVTQQSKPDVVIVDTRMSGGFGTWLIESIKASEEPPAVIILTLFPYPQYRKRCFEAGADFFFDKATEFDRVLELLQGLRAGIGSSLVPKAEPQFSDGDEVRRRK